jgi:hypothetical protein
MNSFDYLKAVTDFWTAQGQALMKAQGQTGAALDERMARASERDGVLS